ncbi:MAG: bifunctional riboflavin kinase/FAD synthetase [Bryobacteraceae bacterium]
MRVFRTLDEARGRFGPAGVSIGNFDGVHLGHQALFARLKQRCAALGATPSVLTFDPHPARVLAPDRAPKLLSTLDARLRWIAECGVEQAMVLGFTRGFAAMEPEEFVRSVLVDAAGAHVVVVGANFHFGRRKAGTTAVLEQLGAGFGFETSVVEGVRARGRVVSSTEVRGLVEAGDVRLAGRLLGRCFSLEGAVVPGAGIGAKQTVPTLNLAPDSEVLPAPGVYVTRTAEPATGREWPSVTNLGRRPTFGGDALSIESFLLAGFDGIAPARIRVTFQYRLRDERKFESASELKAQILRDAARAAKYHARATAILKGSISSPP